ncbi:MAG: laminin B domain-containing protein [Phycisphaerales bacterium]
MSTFDVDSEGWTALGDFSAPVTWVATGGNPGGHIKVVDSVSGGVVYFRAPDKFLGDRSAAYGRTLTFDLKQTISGSPNQFDAVDVFLTGGGLTLAFDLANNPPIGSWQSFSVPLSEAGWRLNTLTGPSASAADMLVALSSLTDLRIRAEYQTGADTDYLDNVVLDATPTADLNGDGQVNAADLGILLGAWGTPGPGDLDGDGVVSAADLAILLGAWTA